MGRALLALSLLALVGCGEDTSTPDGSAAYPDARLEITYQHPDAETYSYSVICGGDTARLEGADLDADAACTSLGDLQVASRLVDGPPDQACPEIYGGPDVASIEGTIDGQEVDTAVDRTDGCGISDWDNLLGDLLPPARGVEAGS